MGTLIRRVMAAGSEAHQCESFDESGGDVVVGNGPAANDEVQVAGAALEKDAQRLGRTLADAQRVVVPAPEVDKAAAVAHDLGECLGVFPGGGEGTNAAGIHAADGAAGRT